MTRVLFVCHGNICRSPMAEFVFNDLAGKRGVSDRFSAESAAVSSEEIGNPVYPPARAALARKGISCAGKRARRVRPSDAVDFDRIVGMDRSNMRYLSRLLPGAEGKCSMLMEWAGEARDVDDPWYTGDFDTCMEDIEEGCEALLDKLMEDN